MTSVPAMTPIIRINIKASKATLRMKDSGKKHKQINCQCLSFVSYFREKEGLVKNAEKKNMRETVDMKILDE